MKPATSDRDCIFHRLDNIKDLKRVGKSEKQEYSEVNAPLLENSYLPEGSVLSSESETSGDGDLILSGVEA
jgi:hypothetical protein